MTAIDTLTPDAIAARLSGRPEERAAFVREAADAGVVTVNAATKTLTRSIPDYWRFDARASYKLTDHIDLSVNAQNVTNKTYFSQTYTSHFASIAAGRTVFGTVNLRF